MENPQLELPIERGPAWRTTRSAAGVHFFLEVLEMRFMRFASGGEPVFVDPERVVSVRSLTSSYGRKCAEIALADGAPSVQVDEDAVVVAGSVEQELERAELEANRPLRP